MSGPLHVPCPHCDAPNRVPPERLGQAPGCGRCHRPLFAAQPLAPAGARFELHAGRSDIPLLVDFWAPWCGPCRTMAPHFAAAAAALEPRRRLAKVDTDTDTDAEPALGRRFAIRSIPTLGCVIHSRAGRVGPAGPTRRAAPARARGRVIARSWTHVHFLPLPCPGHAQERRDLFGNG